ncbi:MAG: hypothetical protein WCS27_05415 [Victivallaceae bacterium]
MIRKTFEYGHGIFRLIPVFVPRRFGLPGHRLRLHPDDYFALGTARGAIKERWFSSVIPAMNGPLAPPDEGLSYILPRGDRMEEKFTLRAAVEQLGAELIGEDLMRQYGAWPMYSKFFDYETPLFHHLHLSDEAAQKVGRIGKPECYYFPSQYNNYPGQFPATYFGFDPMVSREEVKRRLLQYESADNRITELSRAYRIELGTGWYTPPGVVHAPGSCLTYEPQWNSDVNSVYENVTAGEVYPYDFLVENCPPEKQRNVDYILGLMDWEKNTDPDYRRHYFRPPLPLPQSDPAFQEKWIVYGNPYIGAKELTVLPGKEVTVTEAVAHGCVVVQGYGRIGVHEAAVPTLLRYGQMSADEFFVSESAARQGVSIINAGSREPLVILKHFGPNHPEMPGREKEPDHETTL